MVAIRPAKSVIRILDMYSGRSLMYCILFTTQREMSSEASHSCKFFFLSIVQYFINYLAVLMCRKCLLQ